MATRRRRLARWWLDRPLRSKGLAVLAPPVMVLVITVAASFIVERYQVALRHSAAAAAQAGRVRRPGMPMQFLLRALVSGSPARKSEGVH